MDIKKIAILDTSYFIKLKPLEQDTKYLTTEFIVGELKDEKARNFYKLNQDFIEVKNPAKETMHISILINNLVRGFAKSAGDLSSLSIPDISIIALAYETYKAKGQIGNIRKEPIKYEIEKVEVHKQEKPKIKKEEFNWDEYDSQITGLDSNDRINSEPTKDLIEIKFEENVETVCINEIDKEINNEEQEVLENPIKEQSEKEENAKEKEENGNEKDEIETEKEENVFDENDNEWITLDNIEKKLHANTFLKEEEEKNDNKHTIFIITSDFALQNIALKMGILINSIDGIRITKIKNYILKCYACNTFNFDTSRLFCEFCGYTTLMKIGYNVSADGHVVIRDKEADPRLRGTQFYLPNPSIDKKGTVYVLAEDQLPKRRIDTNLEKNFDKLIDNYFQYKDLLVKNNDVKPTNSSKNFVWGFPKKNPNVPKKYYSKKSKK